MLRLIQVSAHVWTLILTEAVLAPKILRGGISPSAPSSSKKYGKKRKNTGPTFFQLAVESAGGNK